MLLTHEVAEIQDSESSSSRRCLLLCSDHSETDHGAVTDAKKKGRLFILWWCYIDHEMAHRESRR